MKKIIMYVAVLGGLAFMTGCTKEPLNNLTEEESRIYITNYDNTVEFNNYKTFSIADTVSVIDNNRLAGRELSSWDARLISALRTEMESRGFVMVDRDENPDLGINVSRLYNTFSGIIEYPNYWGGYGGFYDPFYWGYGGSPYYFPRSYGIYEVTEGAASIDMLDLKNAASANQINGVWNGLLRGTGIFRESNVEAQVKALFEQSPYLRTNQ